MSRAQERSFAGKVALITGKAEILACNITKLFGTIKECMRWQISDILFLRLIKIHHGHFKFHNTSVDNVSAPLEGCCVIYKFITSPYHVALNLVDRNILAVASCFCSEGEM